MQHKRLATGNPASGHPITNDSLSSVVRRYIPKIRIPGMRSVFRSLGMKGKTLPSDRIEPGLLERDTRWHILKIFWAIAMPMGYKQTNSNLRLGRTPLCHRKVPSPKLQPYLITFLSL